ncbi:limonene-1,2-epoxide hydrolase family protein [Nocardioides marmorisolisilvae]|uniref:Epoxide hydrolase n=1 Tax=Nocardioides marmorisolisilvae TaxID=1542737 RepID=A0A3N0DUN0_9ACTN|nr:limonene-1,2-epoxide hydrolase family protein [Nocardioides marmorisolisilvae]RNL79332.1 epoxide hydrolase [Nocardioides marmorisolisilvae]
MNGEISVVRRFFTLLEDEQAAEAVALLAPEVVWKNTGMPTISGRRVGGMLLDMQRRNIGFRADLHHIASDGPVVLTERTDYLTYRRWESAFWVCGTLEVHDGLITLWDDHFSPGGFVAASLKGLVGALRR